MPSQRDVAKRALVTLLLAMAVTYHVTLSNINRDSPDVAVLAAYRQVIKKAHPDRGGQVADAQMLTAAREKLSATSCCVACRQHSNRHTWEANARVKANATPPPGPQQKS